LCFDGAAARFFFVVVALDRREVVAFCRGLSLFVFVAIQEISRVTSGELQRSRLRPCTGVWGTSVAW